MITLFAFFFTFSFSYFITIGVVWITADDNDSPFTRFGTKGVLLRCAAFEFVPLVGAIVAIVILAAAGSSLMGLLFGGLLALVVFLAIMIWAAGLLFEREISEAIVLVVTILGVNLGLAYGLPHMLSTMLS